MGRVRSRVGKIRRRTLLLEHLDSRCVLAASIGSLPDALPLPSPVGDPVLPPQGITESQAFEAWSSLTSTALEHEVAYRQKDLGEIDIENVTQTAQSSSLINLDDFRNDSRFAGIDGTGFSTVIIDSGIDLNHPHFGPDVSPADGVSDRIVFSYDFYDTDDTDASDFDGHGSNVSSIVASSDATHTGMAPAAGIIHLKVFPDGDGGAPGADIEQALQWVVANAATYNIASVNLSLGALNLDFHYAGSLYDEFAALDDLNVIPVVSSGNDFFPEGSTQGMNYIASYPSAVSVGAVYDGNIGDGWEYVSGAIANTTEVDRIAPFTQRHSRLLHMLAPGAAITGASHDGGTLTQHGTSQASPHISGIAVLAQQLAMQQLGRRLSVEEFKTLVQTSGVLLNDGDDENDNVTNTGLNWSRVDVFALGEAILAMEPSDVSGRIFNDQNGDSSGTGDPGLSGWTVFRDQNDNGTLDSGTVVQASADVPQTISLNDTTPRAAKSANVVSGVNGLITDVDVTINITHTYDSDLVATLISPFGERIELFYRVGGGGDNFTNTVLNDEAGSFINTGFAPFSSSFKPMNSLSVLDGTDPNGTWYLEIVDRYQGDGGTLNSWSLDIDYAEQSEVTDAQGEFTFSDVPQGNHTFRQIQQNGYFRTLPAENALPISVADGQTITDVDFGNTTNLGAIVITETDGGTVAAESGSDTFLVSLRNQPGQDVVLLVDSDDDTIADTPTASLTFTNANWNQPQSITVNAADDSPTSENRSVSFDLSVDDVNSDPNFAIVVDSSINVEVTDDEGSNSAPDLDPITTQNRTDGSEINLALSVTDSDNDEHNFALSAMTLARKLDQELDLFVENGQDYFNFLGSNERWARGAGNFWYYLLPNGELYRSTNGSALDGPLIDTLNAFYHQNFAALYNAQAGFDDATIWMDVQNEIPTLLIDPDNNFDGTFFVDVTASDGLSSDTEQVRINIDNLNQPPTISGLSDQVRSDTNSFSINFTINDPENQPTSASSVGQDILNYLDSTYQFFLDPSGLNTNFGGRGEKWVRSTTNGDQWYYIETNGDLYAERGDNSLVEQLGVAVFTDPSLLYEGSGSNSVPAAIAVDNSGANPVLNIDPNESFEGSFFVKVTASDGVRMTDQTIRVTVDANQAPTITPISDQSRTNTSAFTVSVNETDPENDTITTTAAVMSENFYWDQELMLWAGSNDFYNWGGQNEKWFRSIEKGNRWMYILPNGELHDWDGTANTASGPLVATLDSTWHTNWSSLHSATNTSPATANIDGSGDVIVDPTESFIGNFFVEVSVDDGNGNRDSDVFKVTVGAGGSSQSFQPLSPDSVQTFDTNLDQKTSPLDALVILNYLNSNNGAAEYTTPDAPTVSLERQPEILLDTNSDGKITPLDALIILNQLAVAPEGEREDEKTEVRDVLFTSDSLMNDEEDEDDSFFLDIAQ